MAGIHAGVGKDHECLPGSVDTVAVQKEEDGGQPAGIKGLAALKLGLDEDQRRVLPLWPVYYPYWTR